MIQRLRPLCKHSAVRQDQHQGRLPRQPHPRRCSMPLSAYVEFLSPQNIDDD
ncbi:MAG: hypothetical protein GVY09_02895 [Gammaproteobacteria bacterium]|jgi:hypothetical protein|nr:hypothetical protein [Gammaproteobacteria bacterium]